MPLGSDHGNATASDGNAGSDFFSTVGQNIAPYIGQSIGIAAQALPIWTRAQVDKGLGNQIANPTYYYPASDPRLATPLNSTQPLRWTNGQGQVIDQNGNIIPAGYMSDFGQASLSFGQMAVLVAAAIAAVVVLARA